MNARPPMIRASAPCCGPDRTPTPLAGRLMVVFDSAAAAAPSPSS
ncbi:hypothetical protein [Plastoroseomonas hellenica]|nr:hypothetical protein [Plastoroseomonas hellenica]